MKYVFFVNPAAGKGKAQLEIIDAINQFFSDRDFEYEIYITNAKGDALEKSRSLAESGESLRIFACGGEGTVYEVINGVVGYDNVEVGVIPCGSANDFLKYFNERSAFLDIPSQVDGTSLPMDIIKANDRYCLNGCSVGMDAMVARDMSIFKRWPLVSGALAYKLAIVKTFLQPLGITAEISVDDEPANKIKCLFAVVANAPYYGGGYMSAPDAVPYDGKLDFTLVNVISKLRVPKFLSYYEKGQHKSLDYCSLKPCKSMEFTSSEPIPVNLDGEIVETKHMRFEIVKRAIKFIVPKTVHNKLLINV